MVGDVAILTGEIDEEVTVCAGQATAFLENEAGLEVGVDGKQILFEDAMALPSNSSSTVIGILIGVA